MDFGSLGVMESVRFRMKAWVMTITRLSTIWLSYQVPKNQQIFGCLEVTEDFDFDSLNEVSPETATIGRQLASVPNGDLL
jgi:hypothetical protein